METQSGDQPVSDGTAVEPNELDPGVNEGRDDVATEDEELDRDELLFQIARDTAMTKTLVAAVLVVLVIGLTVLGLLVRQDDSDQSTSATTPTSAPDTSATAMDSAAGKPCVAPVDPLPAGAPAVDVVEGPAPTELFSKDLTEGTGATVAATDTVSVNYVGVACSTGQIFDSSYKTGTPAPVSVALDEVIPGFAQGVAGMKVGGQRLIGIPSDQAYGSTGAPPDIAPDEALWFVVEVTATTP